MKKSILIGISIVTVLGIILAAVALGFGDTRPKFNASANAKVNEPVTEKAVQEVQVDTGISNFLRNIRAQMEPMKYTLFMVICD